MCSRLPIKIKLEIAQNFRITLKGFFNLKDDAIITRTTAIAVYEYRRMKTGMEITKYIL